MWTAYGSIAESLWLLGTAFLILRKIYLKKKRSAGREERTKLAHWCLANTSVFFS